jgi:hypothetical protein
VRGAVHTSKLHLWRVAHNATATENASANRRHLGYLFQDELEKFWTIDEMA